MQILNVCPHKGSSMMKKNSLIFSVLLLCSAGQTRCVVWLHPDTAKQVVALAILVPPVSQELGLHDLVRDVARPVVGPLKKMVNGVIPTRISDYLRKSPLSTSDMELAKKVDEQNN